VTATKNKGIPNSWLSGIDITKIDKNFELTDDNNELIDTLKGEGGVAGGGPCCFFRNKEVPCFVQYSPHGGITPTILTSCLKQMDALNLFPCELGKKPFLLLDGHDSRFDLQFLRSVMQNTHGVSASTYHMGPTSGKLATHQRKTATSKIICNNSRIYCWKKKGFVGWEWFWNRPTLYPLSTMPGREVLKWWETTKKQLCKEDGFLWTGPFFFNRKYSKQDTLTSMTKTDKQPFSMMTRGKITVKINGNHGMTGILFHDVIDEHKNHPETMKKNREWMMLADLTKDVETATRKLSSGAVFYNDMVALHSNSVWNNQKKWHDEKQLKEQEKKTTAKRLFFAKKEKCEKIRKRPRASWSIDNIQTLLTYKRQKNDPTIKNKANWQTMLDEYNRHMYRPTPPCSPINDDDCSTNPTSPIHVTDVDPHVEIEEL
jgi:hypothetical protein